METQSGLPASGRAREAMERAPSQFAVLGAGSRRGGNGHGDGEVSHESARRLSWSKSLPAIPPPSEKPLISKRFWLHRTRQLLSPRLRVSAVNSTYNPGMTVNEITEAIIGAS